MVNICIPTFNGTRYLKECLDSVLSQTYKDFEIIVVDDQSTDETWDILNQYAAQDERIRLFRNERNLGLVGNWNRCVELARGEWIKFVFQDDLIAPDCVAKMLSAANSSKSCLTICRRDFLFEEGTSESTRRYYEEHPNPDQVFGGLIAISHEAVCEIALERFGFNCFGEPTATLIHRESFTRYGLFNPNLAMICDTEYWVRVACHEGFTYVPETLASFRVHASSTSAHHFSHRQYRITLDLLALMHEYVYNSIYAPIRENAKGRIPPLNLKELLAKQTASAWQIAIDTAYQGNNPNMRLIEEWERFLEKFPQLNTFVPKKSAFANWLARFWK